MMWKCSYCDISSGKPLERCPLCQRKMEIIGSSSAVHLIDEAEWNHIIINELPGVIAHEYFRLYQLNQENNLLAFQYKLKDAIETVVKYATLSVCSWAKYNNLKNREYEFELVKKSAIPLGDWFRFANEIVAFLDTKEIISIVPRQLYSILKDIPDWDNKNQLTAWRNNQIGHGALGFQEDTAFRKECSRVFRALNDFLLAHLEYFTAQKMSSVDEKGRPFLLNGANNTARNIPIKAGKLYISIESSDIPNKQITFYTEPFIFHQDSSIYFFDELRRNNKCRILSYPAGMQKNLFDDYTINLRNKLLSGNKKPDINETIKDSMLTAEVSNALDRISLEGTLGQKYVSPKHIIEWIRQAVANDSKGVFLLQMERGCGKTVLTEKLNNMYQSPEEIQPGMQVRTYHFNRSQNLGHHEFERALDDLWQSSFDDVKKGPVTDAHRPVRMDDFKDGESKAIQLCKFLDEWKQYSASYRRSKQIMLVLDGLDEITDEKIYEYIPQYDELPENVYILLTGRTTELEQVPDDYILHVSQLVIDSKKIVRADDDDNRKFLLDYIRNQIPEISEDEACSIINSSDSTVLSLSLLCALFENDILLHNESIKGNEVQLFLTVLKKLYENSSQDEKLERLLATLSTFAEEEPLTIDEIAESSFGDGVTFELIGMMNDLAPLLFIERGWHADGHQFSGKNRYHLVNSKVAADVREWLKKSLPNYIYDMVSNVLPSDDDQSIDYSGNESPIVVHCIDVILKYCPKKIELLYRNLNLPDCLYAYSLIVIGDSLLSHNRSFSALEQVIILCQYLIENDEYYAEKYNAVYLLARSWHSSGESLVWQNADKAIEKLIYAAEVYQMLAENFEIDYQEYLYFMQDIFRDIGLTYNMEGDANSTYKCIKKSIETGFELIDEIEDADSVLPEKEISKMYEHLLECYLILYKVYRYKLVEDEDVKEWLDKLLNICAAIRSQYITQELQCLKADFYCLYTMDLYTKCNKENVEALKGVEGFAEVAYYQLQKCETIDKKLQDSINKLMLNIREKVQFLESNNSSNEEDYSFSPYKSDEEDGSELLAKINRLKEEERSGKLVLPMQLISAYHRYGKIQAKSSNYKEAIECYQSALTIFTNLEKTGKPYDSFQLMILLYDYSVALNNVDQIANALELVNRIQALIPVVRKKGNKFGDDDIIAISVYKASLLRRLNRYEEALSDYEHALSIMKKDPEHYLESFFIPHGRHTGIPEVYAKMMFVHHRLNNENKAIDICNTAYDYCAEHGLFLNIDHIQPKILMTYAISANSPAQLESKVNEYKETLYFMELLHNSGHTIAFEQRKKAYHLFAQFAEKNHYPNDALYGYRKYIELIETEGKPNEEKDYSTVLFYLSTGYLSKHQYSDAIRFCEKYIDCAQEQGVNQLSLAKVYITYAVSLFKLNQPNEALSSQLIAIDIYQKYNDELKSFDIKSTFNLISSLTNYSELCVRIKSYKEALKAVQRALKLCNKEVEEQYPMIVARTHKVVIDLYHHDILEGGFSTISEHYINAINLLEKSNRKKPREDKVKAIKALCTDFSKLLKEEHLDSQASKYDAIASKYQ